MERLMLYSKESLENKFSLFFEWFLKDYLPGEIFS